MDNAERDALYSTPLGKPDSQALAAFWQRFVEASAEPIDVSRPEAFCFGDTVELADELIELIINGPKRATAGSLAQYEVEGEAVAVVGDFAIAMDGAMRPRAVIETTDVRIGPLSSVDDQFAWDEGEGDRSRAWWLDAHTWFFTRSHKRLGLPFDADIPVVFERFELRYHED